MKSKDLEQEMAIVTVVVEVVGQFLVQINPRRLSILQTSSARQSPPGLYPNRPPALVRRGPGGLQFLPPRVWQFAARSAAIATPLVQYFSVEPEVLAATQSPMISLLVRPGAHRKLPTDCF